MASLKILDTDVLVDYFRGVAAAKTYIEQIPPDQRAITDVTRMELLRGAQSKKELKNIEQFIAANFALILPISAGASRTAVDLIKRYTLSEGLKLPDALIAAITLSMNGQLVTGNKKDFDYIEGLDVEAPAYRATRANSQGIRR